MVDRPPTPSSFESTRIAGCSRAELEAGVAEILDSPKEQGTLSLIVKRPAVDERSVVETGVLSVGEGLEGDNWKSKGSRMTADGSAHPEMQITIMNARAAALVAQDKSRWGLAGDQLYVDMDLSGENLPPGSQLQIGGAIVEISAIPHRGCKKFVQRFGRAAMEFVNSQVGCRLNLRGINTKVIRGGEINVGDPVRILQRGAA